MTLHVCTPEEIDGALDESEVQVIHLLGWRQGMLLAHKKSDPALRKAVADRAVMIIGGLSLLPPPEHKVVLDEFGSGNIRLGFDGLSPPIDFLNFGWHQIQITHAPGKTDADWQNRLTHEVGSQSASISYASIYWDNDRTNLLDVAEVLSLIDSGTTLWIYLHPNNNVYCSRIAPPELPDTVTVFKKNAASTDTVLDVDGARPKLDFSGGQRHRILLSYDYGQREYHFTQFADHPVGTVCVDASNGGLTWASTNAAVLVKELLPLVGARTIVIAYVENGKFFIDNA